MSTIIPLPSKCFFETVDSLRLARAGVSMRSRYTGKRQVAMYPFAVWTLSGTLIKMEGTDAGQWRSFLAQLHGQANTFRLPVPGTESGPLSGFTGTAQVDTAETLGSNEVSITTTGTTSTVSLSWNAVTGATGYYVRRGTSAGNESVYYSAGNITSFTDTGAVATNGTTPTTTAATASPPTLNAPTTATTGGTLAAGTYYYRVTALVPGASIGATSVAVTTTGGGASFLAVGDYFTVNDELKLCTAACATGTNVALSFEPFLRSAVTAGMAITVTNPTMLVAAVDNDAADWSLGAPVQHQVKLKLIEAF